MSDSNQPDRHRMRGRFQMALMATWMRMGRDLYQAHQFEIVPLEVPVRGLHTVFSGYRIAQVTDLHMGHWITAPRLNGVVELINALQPDLVVLTGDFVSYVVDEIADDLEQGLSRLQAPDGVLAILGNHDHWMGAERISQILSRAGARVLRNEVATIQRLAGVDMGSQMESNARLHIAGLDDIMVRQHDLEAVIAMLPPGEPAILLAHEPDFADTAAASGCFALMLSGHSHGGQIVLPRLGPLMRGPMFWKYPLGRYQVGEMVQYTNRGIGTHVMRVRINCRPEITNITLVPA